MISKLWVWVLWNQLNSLETSSVPCCKHVVGCDLEQVVVTNLRISRDMEPVHSKVLNIILAWWKVMPHADVIELFLRLIRSIGDIRCDKVAIIFKVLEALC